MTRKLINPARPFNPGDVLTNYRTGQTVRVSSWHPGCCVTVMDARNRMSNVQWVRALGYRAHTIELAEGSAS